MIWLPVVGNYADIDVYASIIAYADLLNQRGKPAKTYSAGIYRQVSLISLFASSRSGIPKTSLQSGKKL